MTGSLTTAWLRPLSATTALRIVILFCLEIIADECKSHMCHRYGVPTGRVRYTMDLWSLLVFSLAATVTVFGGTMGGSALNCFIYGDG